MPPSTDIRLTEYADNVLVLFETQSTVVLRQHRGLLLEEDLPCRFVHHIGHVFHFLDRCNRNQFNDLAPKPWRTTTREKWCELTNERKREERRARLRCVISEQVS
jgi:hypothetical protein